MVPTNGNSDAAHAQATSIGSSMRRRASANVQKISAAQMTIRTRIRTLTAVLSASLLMPKTPRFCIGGRARLAVGVTGTADGTAGRARGTREGGARRRPRRSASAAAGAGRRRSQRGPPARPRLAQEVGHEVDGAGRDDRAVGARERPGALDRAPRVGLDLARAPELA